LRSAWGIPNDAFCVLFCGKFVAKKRPMDLVHAATLLLRENRLPNIHLLFVGSGELGGSLRNACRVVYDADVSRTSGSLAPDPATNAAAPPASFAGFLNQTEISRAYVAADCLVLPSDHGETWGLVVNEALASQLMCVTSDACGCSEDIVASSDSDLCFPCGNIASLAAAILHATSLETSDERLFMPLAFHSLITTVDTLAKLAERYLTPKSCTSATSPVFRL
jgi:glycosyltransferase involved in cell wall biosynthesis